MLKPFYQGKLDSFCAVYAVLNAFRLIRGIRTSQARDILNTSLLGLSARPAAFRAFLLQETDYVELVDSLLGAQAPLLHIEVSRPFAGEVDEEEFWNVCSAWLGPRKEGKTRAMILRFIRYLKPGDKPMNRHWTTADYMQENVLHLFDCSHEAEAILNIRRGEFATRQKDVAREKLLHIQPQHVRFARLAI